MTDVDELRERYVAALSDVRDAERDRSQLLAALARVANLFETARRGDDVGDADEALDGLASVTESWDYALSDLREAGVFEGRPGFAAFGVDHPAALEGVLEEAYFEQREAEFEALVACLRDAIAGGGESFEPVTDAVDDLVRAYEHGDPEEFDVAIARLVGDLEDRAVVTGAQLRTLLAAERGENPGSELLSLQNDRSIRAQAAADLEEAIGAGDAEAFAAARRPFEAVAATLDEYAATRRGDLATVTKDLTDEYPEDHADPHPDLDHGTPTLLTPTRLETRFVEHDDPDPGEPAHELLIRVYPDDLHVDTHERPLTDAEVERGARFWQHVWWASHDETTADLLAALPESASAEDYPDWLFEEAGPGGFPRDDPAARHEAIRERAWNTVVERFGPERAAWVKRRMAPAAGDVALAGPDEMGSLADGDVEAFETEMDERRADVDRRPGSWTRPPRARLLPDQWIAFAEVDGDEKTATSNPVERPLSIGPDPGSLQSATETDAEHEDFREGEMKWVFDFDEDEERSAMAVGMGLRLPLTEDEKGAGVDRLVVLGVSTGLDQTAAAERVADLLEAHRHTDGLAMLERGTPTNDTREDGAGTAPAGEESVYERECTLPAISPDDAGADGARAAELLGIDPATIGDGDRFVFDRVRGAARSLDATAEAVNAALWSATVGYYVPHLLAPHDWTPGERSFGSVGDVLDAFDRRLELLRWLESYRRHFVAYVRAGGPAPPLRIGSQPYGILPTTAFGDWSDAPGLETAPEPGVATGIGDFEYERFEERDVPGHLSDLLDALRPLWEGALGDVPTVDSADDPELVVSKLLEMSGTSYGYRLRDFFGSETVALLDEDPIPQARFDEAREGARDQLGRAADRHRVPRVGNLVGSGKGTVVDASVTRGELASSLRVLRTTRHDGLRTGPPGFDLDLEDVRVGDTWLWSLFLTWVDRSLAQVLCYYAILQEYRLARVRFGYHYEQWHEELERGVAWRRTPWSLVPEPSVYGDGDMTMWEALEHDITGFLASVREDLGEVPRTFDAGWTVGDLLRNVPAVDRPFGELVSAFETLEDADPALLDGLIRETLDLASHRYDAWATSLATRRLAGMREAGDGGLYVGAYGYVEDLQARDSDEEETDERSKGYVQAPSIDQATAAAVLRSAHDAETDEYGDLFAVDLSADRVREALDLLEGVRAGHSLGELLGARFERALHEDYPDLELDQYVYAFRSLAPLVEGRIDREGAEESDAVAERDVVDGATLYELRRNREIPWGEKVGSPEGIEKLPQENGGPKYDALVAELDAIGTAFDSVSDVLAAESVYQLVRDNPERAGGALDALSRGGTIDEVEVVDTPRTGTSTTHRLVTLLDADATGAAWAPGDSPRAAAEPSLDDWASTTLGDPVRVVCRVAYEVESDDGEDGSGNGDGDDGEGEGADDAESKDWHVVAVRLSELDLSALDAVSLVEGDEAAWGSELEARIEYHVRRTRADVDVGAELRLSFTPPADWPDAEALGVDPEADVGFGELLEVARAVRSVVSNARPIDARDVTLPGEAGEDGRVVSDLDDRAEDASQAFSEAVDALAAQAAVLAADPETDERVVDDLAALVDAVGALPTGPVSDAVATLEDLEPDQLHDDLRALVDAAARSAALVGVTEDGKIILTREEAYIEGLVGPEETVEVQLVKLDGTVLSGRVEVDDDGHFRAEFYTDGLEDGDEFTITVQRESGETVRFEGLFREDAERPSHSLSLAELGQFATLADAFDEIESAIEPVVTAREGLDGDVVDDAFDELDDWPAEAAADLAAVRGVPDVSIPGIDSPSGWERIATVALAVDSGGLAEEAIEETGLDEGVPSPSALDELLEALEDALEDLDEAIEVAGRDGEDGRRPDEALVAAAQETIRAALLTCADFGVHGSVPLSATGSDREDMETLARQADSVHDEAADMLQAAEDHRTRGDAENDPDAYVACLEALFGENFTVLVPFEPTNAGEFDAALDPANGRSLQDDDPLAVERWFDRVEPVREEFERFGRALTYGETFGARSPADGARFRVGQLPYEAEDTWVGLPEAWADEHPAGRLSLVAHVRGSQAGDRYVGLFVGEFVETVPNEAETTGLSFHYDRPSNQAPQSMLLAVPPTEENWSVETLADVVRESVELAKLRTVDHEALGDLGQLLPGLALATNESADPVGPDTASVDPEDLMAGWRAVWGGGA